MITRVRLVNWRSHLDSEVEFSPGTNVLTGIMGSGKTSMMNAICFGLFGTFPDLQTRRVRLDDIIMAKPHVKDKAEVTVTFNLDGEEYTVFRAIEKGKGTSYSELRKGEQLLDAPQPQRVTEQIQNLLKIDYELFSKAIYSEQNGLDYFLRLTRGERMKRIDNLMMIDRYEKARASAVTLRNKITERKLAKQSLVEQTDLPELERTISEIGASMKESEESKKKLMSELDVLKNQIGELEKKVRSFEETERELNELKQEKKSLEASIQENQQSIEEIKKLLKGRGPKEIETRLAELKDKMNRHKEELQKHVDLQEKLTSTLSEYKAKIQYFEKEIKDKQDKIQKKSESKRELSELRLKYSVNPPELLESKRKELEKVNNELAVLDSKLQELNTLVEQLGGVVDECPVCKERISGDKKRHLIQERKAMMEKNKTEIESHQSQRRNLSEDIKSLKEIAERFKELSFEVKDLEKLENELKETESSYKEVKTESQRKEEELQSVKKRISEVQDVLKRLEPEVSELDIVGSRLDELKRRESRTTEHKERLSDVENRIGALQLKVEKADIENLRKSYEDSIGRRSELKTKVDSVVEILEEREKRKKELEGKQEQLKKQMDEIRKLESLARDLTIFEIALANTQVQLRREFIGAVNYTMNDIWPDIYPYTDFSGIRLAIEESDYVLQLQDRAGRWVDVEGVASGGERTIAALALRIAFSLVLAPQLKWLILDEPTLNLDSRAVEDLATTLRNRIGDFVTQVFLITHDKALENAATGELYRLHRNKEIDDATKSERATGV